MANLASTYQNLGKYTEAEKLEMQVLDARNRILGVEHPDTITAMANLASTYRNLGKYTEAEKLEMQVLDARNRILGVEHPDTITAMANLAATYQNLGKYTEAEKLKCKFWMQEQNSWSGAPRYNQGHERSSINIL
jgi:tetratricopeptide (TPR) repeat protein